MHFEINEGKIKNIWARKWLFIIKTLTNLACDKLPRWTIKCPSWDIRKLSVFQVGYWAKQGTEKLEGIVWELEGRLLLILGWTLQKFPQVFPYDSRLYSSRISRVFSVLASESSWVGMEQACVVDAAWIPAHHPAPLQPKDPLLLLLHSLSLSLPKGFVVYAASYNWKSCNGCWPIACQDIRLWHSKLIT